ncbi:MAG TPA: hypothetical protein VKI45_11150 [Allosphingosinicella sp.]|nr:hypothetical protein [Allosphingosinicella sp.]
MRIGWWMAGAALIAGAAEAKMVSAGDYKSWGKAGISLDAYRADGLACARDAAAMDLSKTDPARALVIASRLIDNDPSSLPGPTIDPMRPQAGSDVVGMAGSSASIVQTIGPQRQILKAGDIMKARLETCLARRGYVKFKLTAEQRKRLRGLREGSDERRLYLHSLASDGDVLARQRLN